MGNIPLHFNCLCPVPNPKEDDNLLQEMQQIDEAHKNRHNETNKTITKLEHKIDRLEDKIEMKFEMLFLNMKIIDKRI